MPQADLSRPLKGVVPAVVTFFLSTVLIGRSLGPDQFDPEEVTSVHEREVRHARSLGFSEVEEQFFAGDWSYRFTVEPGDCVAIVGSMAGRAEVYGLDIRPADGPRDGSEDIARAHYGDSVPVRHVQACASEAGRWMAMMKFYGPDITQSGRFTILRGRSDRIGGNDALTRGWVPIERYQSSER